jgi:biotin synthase
MEQSSGPVDALQTQRLRRAAGSEDMSGKTRASCFLAGVNSIFYGLKLLTTPNPGCDKNRELMERLGMEPPIHPPPR